LRFPLKSLSFGVSSLYRDPLFRGFFFITNVLLGIGLEQGLIKDPSIALEIYFLLGLILGLYLGFLSWRFLKSFSLNFWFIEGLLIGLLLWRETTWLFFLQGLFFGPLMLHVFLISRYRPFNDVFWHVSLGIVFGNIFLFLAKNLPHEMSILVLSLLLVGWRLRKPEVSPEEPLSLNFNIDNSCFWFFIILFYLLGGFYYSCLFVSFTISGAHFDFVSFVSYSLPVLLSLLLIRFYSYFPLFSLVMIALGLVWQFSSFHFGEVPLSFLEAGFAFVDVFSLVYILVNFERLFEVAFSFSLFPVSILLGLFLLRYFEGNLLREYQVLLTGILLMIIPSILFLRKRKVYYPASQILALPPVQEPTSTKGQDKALKEDNFDWELYHNLNLPLSKREEDVFLLLLKNYKIKEISRELKLAIGTVKSICNRIYEKLGVKSKKDLLQKYKFLLSS